MAIIKRIKGLAGKEYFWITILTLVILLMHFLVITRPPEVMFDEVYYVQDGRNILDRTASVRGEHPPLGQLLVAGGMALFGDNPLGWRFDSVLFGSANVFLLYLICRRLKLSRFVSLLAVFIFAFENLNFVQSSVAMLDVFSLTFMLMCFWLYLRGDYPLASIAGVLAALSKLSGVLVFFAIVLHWLIARRDRQQYFYLSLLLAVPSYVLLLVIFDFAFTGNIIEPLHRTLNMLTLTRSITFESSQHIYGTRPWDWLINYRAMPYYYNPDYTGMISPTLWALIIPTVGYLCFRIFVKKDNAALFAGLWFLATYLTWVPLEFASNRITYVFYFYPSVGAISIGLGIALCSLYGVWQNRSKKAWLRVPALIVFILYLAAHLATFVFLAPVFSQWLPDIRRQLIFWGTDASPST